mmetsp:Transcript_14071/g.21336  ORF Transcript_14071/g.21336 Transcript_14071/m.21336 type:complete len:1284 (+) Transcript_14071:170-4021(+)
MECRRRSTIRTFNNLFIALALWILSPTALALPPRRSSSSVGRSAPSISEDMLIDPRSVELNATEDQNSIFNGNQLAATGLTTELFEHQNAEEASDHLFETFPFASEVEGTSERNPSNEYMANERSFWTEGGIAAIIATVITLMWNPFVDRPESNVSVCTIEDDDDVSERKSSYSSSIPEPSQNVHEADIKNNETKQQAQSNSLADSPDNANIVNGTVEPVQACTSSLADEVKISLEGKSPAANKDISPDQIQVPATEDTETKKCVKDDIRPFSAGSEDRNSSVAGDSVTSKGLVIPRLDVTLVPRLDVTPTEEMGFKSAEVPRTISRGNTGSFNSVDSKGTTDPVVNNNNTRNAHQFPVGHRSSSSSLSSASGPLFDILSAPGSTGPGTPTTDNESLFVNSPVSKNNTTRRWSMDTNVIGDVKSISKLSLPSAWASPTDSFSSIVKPPPSHTTPKIPLFGSERLPAARCTLQEEKRRRSVSHSVKTNESLFKNNSSFFSLPNLFTGRFAYEDSLQSNRSKTISLKSNSWDSKAEGNSEASQGVDCGSVGSLNSTTSSMPTSPSERSISVSKYQKSINSVSLSFSKLRPPSSSGISLGQKTVAKSNVESNLNSFEAKRQTSSALKEAQSAFQKLSVAPPGMIKPVDILNVLMLAEAIPYSSIPLHVYRKLEHDFPNESLSVSQTLSVLKSWSFNCKKSSQHAREGVTLFEKLVSLHEAKGSADVSKIVTTVMEPLIKYGFFSHSLRVYNLAEKYGVYCDGEVYRQALLSVANDCKKAKEIFENMKSKGRKLSEQIYSLLIRVFYRNGKFRQASQYFNEMIRSGLQPVSITYAFAISSHVRVRAFNVAKQMYQKVKGFLSEANLSFYTTIICACEKAGGCSLALFFLNELEARNIPSNEIPYNATISLLRKSSQLSKGMELLRRMQNRGIRPDVVTFNTLLSKCERTGDKHSAWKLFSEMKALGIPRDTITYNSLISCYGRAGDFNMAMRFFEEMEAEKLSRDAITFTSAITACGKAKNAEKAIQLFEAMKTSGIEYSVVSYTAIISACERARLWREALRYFKQLRSHTHVKANVLSYTAAISACAQGREWRDALEILENMRSEGVEANQVTYGMAIRACSRAGVWQPVSDLITQMERLGVDKGPFCYSEIISACVTSGFPSRALEHYKLMRSEGVGPNRRIFSMVLTSAQNLGAMNSIAEIARDIQNAGITNFFHPSLQFIQQQQEQPNGFQARRGFGYPNSHDRRSSREKRRGSRGGYRSRKPRTPRHFNGQSQHRYVYGNVQ